ncbi:MAG: hypothetical protein MJZ57_09375 [Bacteroidales bacterium]|nr:hypothetical protein [Bacteroidales bacterium]
MRTTSSKKPGNRRSENNPVSGPAPASAPSVAVSPMSATPKISSQVFNYPGRPQLNKIPSIKDIVDPAVPTAPVVAAEPQPASDAPAPQVPADVEPPAAAEAPQQSKEEVFLDCWSQLVDELFVKTPTLYFTMKRTEPTYDNDVITIEVKNKIQEEELDKRRRVILEYWRNHFQLNVDDLEIVVNEDKVTSTAILSADEQFQKMKEQNPELLDFLNALNFRMKD